MEIARFGSAAAKAAAMRCSCAGARKLNRKQMAHASTPLTATSVTTRAISASLSGATTWPSPPTRSATSKRRCRGAKGGG